MSASRPSINRFLGQEEHKIVHRLAERIFGKYPATLLQTEFWPTEPYALKRLPYRALSRVFKCPLSGGSGRENREMA